MERRQGVQLVVGHADGLLRETAGCLEKFVQVAAVDGMGRPGVDGLADLLYAICSDLYAQFAILVGDGPKPCACQVRGAEHCPGPHDEALGMEPIDVTHRDTAIQ